ncbi:hypothetical protein MMC13_003024 [Lambiella insularis]|nr:hypothetical protein [Lambiella insularis]
MADSTPKSYSTDPNLWLYTSLTSGSSHIITATSRLETILKANKIPFKALDVATDEKARMLWGRRAGKRKLPGLVRMGMVVADLEDVEEWNEYGEIKQNLLSPDAQASLATPTPSALSTPSKPQAVTKSSSPAPSPAPNPSAKSTSLSASTETPLETAMRQASLEAAAKANLSKLQAQAALKSRSGTKPTDSHSGAPDSTSKMLSKLDNAAPGKALPPTGTTEASEATEAAGSVQGAEEKRARSAVRFKGAEKRSESSDNGLLAKPVEITKHRGSDVSTATPEEIKAVEENAKIAEEPEKEQVAEEDKGKEVAGEPQSVKTEDAAAATDEEVLPGTRTQDQEAAKGAKTEESVAD